MPDEAAIGFIGLGVMGEAMCRNLVTKSGRPVIGYDISDAALVRLAAHGVIKADNIAEVAQSCQLIFLALPSGKFVAEVCNGLDGLLGHAKPGAMMVDLGTSPVSLTRELAGSFAGKRVEYVDAPIARTRQAAEAGTLSIMVGASDANFARVRPLLAYLATDITHCGPVGAGQIVKIMNNMVLIQTVVALSEAKAVAERAGMDGKILFETLAKGSADSFALRNHGLKAIIPALFPERAFSTEYALKDLGYALDLARDAGLSVPSAELAAGLLQAAIDAGYGGQYWPVVSRVVSEPG
jgi:3-hydroxyisobutyrate dehydrogenase-like beta-hydroxyacid dehydrogenase